MADTTIIIIILLSSLVLTPIVYAAQMPKTNQKDSLRMQIEDGFEDYLRKENVRIDAGKSPDAAFRAFLRANPQFQKQLEEYTNLTKAENNLKTQDVPDKADAKIGPVFKTVTTTINGTTYQMKYSKGESATGQNFLKISFGGNGTDPWSWITITYLTINLFGWIITYGELQEWTQAYLTSDEAHAYLDFFDTQIITGAGAVNFLWAIFGTIGGLLSGGVCSAIAAAEIWITDTDITLFSNKVHEAVSEEEGEGLWIKTVNTYHYPLYVPFVGLSNFQVYVRQFFNQGNWALAFPYYGSYWMMATPLGNEVTAWIVSQQIHGIGDAGGYDQWDWIPDPPTPPTGPPPGPTGLTSVTVNGYDTTHSNSLNGVNIVIDGFDVGTTPSTYTVTPEPHYVNGVNWPQFHYYYENIEGYPPEEPEGPTEVEITSNVTITMNYEYIPSHWLIVETVDDLGYPVCANIYVDGLWVGSEGLAVQVTEGWHSISVNDPAWSDLYVCYIYLDYFTDYYGNSESRPVYSDTYVQAVYDYW